jgi:hypothetical protein
MIPGIFIIMRYVMYNDPTDYAVFPEQERVPHESRRSDHASSLALFGLRSDLVG